MSYAETIIEATQANGKSRTMRAYKIMDLIEDTPEVTIVVYNRGTKELPIEERFKVRMVFAELLAEWKRRLVDWD